MKLEIVECPICNGTGIRDGTNQECGTCNGEGKLVFPKQDREMPYMLDSHGKKHYWLPADEKKKPK